MPDSDVTFTHPARQLPPAALVSFAERGFPQANRITLTKSCCCNNSKGHNFTHRFRPAGVA